ncbi:uncharacterized protein C7orf50-like isoform X3 [Suricata suricatta]|uniref:uncharacterized protein C7orf50-like isoform X3 n=1 Tax=Suricata suricatta TaxID=37032 RepID=UPI001155606F|nr:uncharacterized protein C7orf50-like isoform X3 [Suricata suricatta]
MGNDVAVVANCRLGFQGSGLLELPDLGRPCWEDPCKRLDFLPLTCDACKQDFCKDHFTCAAHKCLFAFKKDIRVPVCPLCNKPVPVKKGAIPDVVVGEHMDRDCSYHPGKKEKVFIHQCSKQGCKKKEMLQVTCDQCHGSFCIQHRHPLDHSCQHGSRAISVAGMAKRKRAVTKVTEKKNKRWKKASVKEMRPALAATPGTGEAHAEGVAVGAGQDATLELPELSPEEKRVLERKLKKERRKEERKQLQEKGAAQSPQAKRSRAQQALDYLRGWAQKHENWRFQKTRQTWLLLHMYDSDQVPDELFSTLLAYLEGLKGRARELTVQKAEALMQESDEASGKDALPLGTARRIRQVLQLLS